MKKVLWDNYQIGNLIGEGVNGKVYKAYKKVCADEEVIFIRIK